MNKQFAEQAKRHALLAAKELNEIIKLSEDWTEEDMNNIRRAVGLSIGKIEVGILSELYRNFPELDDIEI